MKLYLSWRISTLRDGAPGKKKPVVLKKKQIRKGEGLLPQREKLDLLWSLSWERKAFPRVPKGGKSPEKNPIWKTPKRFREKPVNHLKFFKSSGRETNARRRREGGCISPKILLRKGEGKRGRLVFFRGGRQLNTGRGKSEGRFFHGIRKDVLW